MLERVLTIKAVKGGADIKTGILKYFAIFTGKHLCCRLFKDSRSLF